MPSKRSYQKELDQVIKDNGAAGKRPSLLLHACCAPCSSYVLEYLSEYFDITVFYYNPNISPKEEYDFRVSEIKRLISEMKPSNVSFCEGRYDPERYAEAVRGLENEPEGGDRCTKCFSLRLDEAAKKCAELGLDYFTTTLTISPLKNAEKLNKIGEIKADEYGLRWLPSDFKKKDGYKRSIELSRMYDLYRQDYCGCIYSKRKDIINN